jgi:hypothetical protein
LIERNELRLYTIDYVARSLFLPAVETVDVTTLIELFNRAGIDEVLRFSVVRLRVGRGELIYNRIQPRNRWILLGRQLLLVNAMPVFFEMSRGYAYVTRTNGHHVSPNCTRFRENFLTKNFDG